MQPASPTYQRRIGCVIMASGLGRRFGSNKLMADFLGEPMILHAIRASQGLFDRCIVVTRHESVADLCAERHTDALLHSFSDRSDTVRLGIQAIGDVHSCLFCPGDQPLLRRESISALLHAASKEPQAIWRLSHEGIPGAPILFPRWAFDELSTLPPGKGGGYLAKKYPERVRLLPVADQYELMDADTREDLTFLLQHAQQLQKQRASGCRIQAL